MILETIYMHIITNKSLYKNLNKKTKSNILNPFIKSLNSKFIIPSKILNNQKIKINTKQNKNKKTTATPITIISSNNQVGKYNKIDPNIIIKSNIN